MTDEVTILPDGSAFAVMSFPLPKDHWLYKATEDGFTAPPPMPWRMGSGDARQAVADKIRAAARYAVQASTMRGRDEDFDPDAMVQNMVVGMLGYWTPDGLSSDIWANPEPAPPIYPGDEMHDKCAGCMTPDEKDETIAELAAERDAICKILDSILAADSAYRKALDDDYGGEQLAEAFGDVWDALKEAQTARAALSARSLEVE